MRITADTNVLLRAAVSDDPRQAKSAAAALRGADLIAVPVAALCEFVWVMRHGYKRPCAEIATSVRALVNGVNVATNRPIVEAGLHMLDAGGDFADGVIAYEGEWLGAEELVSFDRKAVAILTAKGKRARLLH